ncbi:cytochrome b [Reinekea blandensis]|uniref:Cytochrome b561, putative n=1 Tax=Reinekea blandensis MED297 TaxID=314283 RepID=A4BB36_9GAMM|nr:cytochrome b [Reinekea blandensis]EAR10649.1 cytochrome b561, putative [Reinekea sp. MED297] [Reinekea blandensis MED297]
MTAVTSSRLSRLTIGLHWFIAIGFMALLVSGLIMENMDRGPAQFQLMNAHKSLGSLFFLVAAFRVGYRMLTGFPTELSNKPRWQASMAHGVHWVLLAATVLVPLSGIAMTLGNGFGYEVFGMTLVERGEPIVWLRDMGRAVHGAAPKVMIAVIVLHTVAAIRQQFVDGSLSRMLGR